METTMKAIRQGLEIGIYRLFGAVPQPRWYRRSSDEEEVDLYFPSGEWKFQDIRPDYRFCYWTTCEALRLTAQVEDWCHLASGHSPEFLFMVYHHGEEKRATLRLCPEKFLRADEVGDYKNLLLHYNKGESGWWVPV